MGIFDKLKEKNKQAKTIYEENKNDWKTIYKVLCKKDRRRLLKLIGTANIKGFIDGLCEECKNNPIFEIKDDPE